MRTRTATLALLALAPFAVVAASDAAYDAANAQGVEDATNPAYQDWYLGEMRPAFTLVVEASLGQCASLARGNELSSLGLVFVVEADGSVGDFFSSRDTDFARCLEAGIRTGKFPPAPKDGFYFGLDFAPPTTST